MLGKLFKYEFKSMARWMLPTYAFVAIMCVINMIMVPNLNDYRAVVSAGILYNLLRVLVATVFGMSIFGVYVVTFIVAASKFYKNLISNEGYISLTLPVTIDQHLAVKLLTALAWTVITALIITLAGFLTYSRTVPIKEIFTEISEGWQYFTEEFANAGLNFNLVVFQLALSGIIGTAAGYLQVYFAMALGQMHSKHKVGMAIVAYMGINIVLQIISTVLLSSFISSMTYGGAFNDINPLRVIIQYCFVLLIFEIILAGGFYFGTRWILKNRINLQ
ncbi:MAG: hypothetical protein IJR47_04015 [Clostridia bacterium]|nr:hypothetical protein [Clostridia bacterium]